MIPIGELTARFPREGHIEAILLRPARRAEPVLSQEADVTAEGLAGDHAPAGLRAVTLIQAEHLPVIAALTRRSVGPERLRRNLVVSALNLAALRGWTLRVGAATLRVTGPCPPCSRMEETLGEGGYNAVRGHGGWYAEVVTPGTVCLGDAVVPFAAG